MAQVDATILLVDDDPAQRLALQAVVADLDVRVVEAPSGREALRRLLEEEFALILLDVNMPGIDGFETAALIRGRERSQHTPIIFITAYSDDAHAARGYSLGAVDFIMAPVDPEVLRTKVTVFIDLYRKTREVTQQREALRRYAAQLHQLSAASLAINSAQSIAEVLQVTAESAAQIIGAHQAGTSGSAPGGGVVTVLYLSEKYGGLRDVRRLNRLPAPPWLDLRQPVRLAADADGGADDAADGAAGQVLPPPLAENVPLRGWLAVPLSDRDGRPVGLIQLSDKEDGDFTAEDEGIVVQLGQMASIAIDNIAAIQAREANRLKDEFLGVLSHELRTPLQAMLTWLSILRAPDVEPATLARGLDVVERSTRAQAQLINDLLDVSRIVRGQLRLESGPVELDKVVDLAIESLKPAAAAKSIRIVFATGPRPRIIGDVSRLQQIAWNLLSNAVKFTPAEGVVEIELKEDDRQVSMEVRDSGPGIPADFLPHVFERFRQADSTTGRRHGGLGLGLAIVRHLVELHGGSVQADNRSNGGAVFTVVLPRHADAFAGLSVPAAAAVDRAVTPPPPPSSNGVRLDGIRIMLVEDEPQARESLTAALQHLGGEVVAFPSADGVLAALETSTPHVLLSDIGMADTDGYALIQAVRAREGDRGGHVPAAALTAYVRPEDRAAALRAGFDTHIGKPVEPLQLARVIRQLARGSRADCPTTMKSS